MPRKAKRSVRDLSGVELGWVAGIIEGEGCIYRYGKASHTYAAIHVWNNQRDLLLHLQQVVGGGNVTARPLTAARRRTGSKSDAWVWVLGRQADVTALLDQIYSLLSAKQKARADRALA